MGEAPAARRRFWAQWGLAAAASAFSLVMAECLVRLLPLPAVKRIASRQQAQLGAREVHPRGLYRLDRAVGWTLTPGFSARFRGEDFDILVEANPDGLRDRALGPKAAGTFRILGLGDSFAFGWGVENAESLFKVLERRLHESGGESGGDNYQVINAGIPGFGTYEELQLLKSVGLRYQPDLVVLAFYEGNDYQNNGDAPRKRVIEDGYLRDRPRGGGVKRALVGHSMLAALTLEALAGVTRKISFQSDLRRTRDLLTAMKALLDARKIPLLLLFIPDQDPEVYRRPALLRAYDRLLTGTTLQQSRDEIRDLCMTSGIPFCRLSNRFESPAAPGLRLKDTHFSRRGHEAAAEELLLCLRQLGLPRFR